MEGKITFFEALKKVKKKDEHYARGWGGVRAGPLVDFFAASLTTSSIYIIYETWGMKNIRKYCMPACLYGLYQNRYTVCMQNIYNFFLHVINVKNVKFLQPLYAGNKEILHACMHLMSYACRVC